MGGLAQMGFRLGHTAMPVVAKQGDLLAHTGHPNKLTTGALVVLPAQLGPAAEPNGVALEEVDITLLLPVQTSCLVLEGVLAVLFPERTSNTWLNLLDATRLALALQQGFTTAASF